MKFFVPPHPSSNRKIRREDLPEYEKLNRYVAQRKFNGTHVVIPLDADHNILEIYDRRGTPLTLYRLTDSMKQCIRLLDLKGNTPYVLNGELLHTKAVSKITGEQAVTNTIVLFDLLMEGEYLTGWTFPERYKRLTEICGNPMGMDPKCRALAVMSYGNSKLWLAETFEDDFLYRFDEFFEFHAKTKEDKFPELEGLVLKERKESTLLPGDRLTDVNWIVKCRKKKPKMYNW